MSHLRRTLILFTLAIIVFCAWAPHLGPFGAPLRLDASATAKIEAGTVRAVATYAAARALNAGIAAVMSTTVAVQPGGVGMTFAPAQALVPLERLVEQFSDLMLVAVVSFGVQRVFIEIGSTPLVSVLLTVAAAIVGLRVGWSGSVPSRISKILLALVLIRFAMPLAVVGSEVGFEHFLRHDYEVGHAMVEDASKGEFLLTTAATQAKSSVGLYARIKGWMHISQLPTNLDDYIEKMLAAAKGVVSQLVNLIVVFLLQTLVLPLLLLWCILQLMKSLTGFVVSPRVVSGASTQIPDLSVP